MASATYKCVCAALKTREQFACTLFSNKRCIHFINKELLVGNNNKIVRLSLTVLQS